MDAVEGCLHLCNSLPKSEDCVTGSAASKVLRNCHLREDHSEARNHHKSSGLETERTILDVRVPTVQEHETINHTLWRKVAGGGCRLS